MISWLTAEQSYALLRGARVTHLGVVERGEPYVVPVNYFFDGEYLYLHSLPGRRVDAIRSLYCSSLEQTRDPCPADLSPTSQAPQVFLKRP